MATVVTTHNQYNTDFKSPISVSGSHSNVPTHLSSSQPTVTNTGSAPTPRVTIIVPPPVRPFSQFGLTTAKLLTDHYTFNQQKFRVLATAKGRIPYTVEYGVIAEPSIPPSQTATSTTALTPPSAPAFSLNGYLFGAYTGPQLSYQYIGYTNENTGDSTVAELKRPFNITGLTLKSTLKSLDRGYGFAGYNGSAGFDYLYLDQLHVGANVASDLTSHVMEASASVRANRGLSVGGNLMVQGVTPGGILQVGKGGNSPSFALARYNVGFEQEYGNWLVSAYTSPSYTPMASANGGATLLETNFNKVNLGVTKVVSDRHTISALAESILKDPTTGSAATSPAAHSLTIGSTYKLNPASLVKGKIHAPSGVVSLALENRFASPKLTYGMAFQGEPLKNRLSTWGLNMTFGEY